MQKIKEIVQINSGYASYVDLYPEYNDFEKNRGRMKRYMPIKAHRDAFEKVAKALYPKDRRFYFLSGSYGTGKSHLLLMLANFFANHCDLPEMESFYKYYEEAQKDYEIGLKPGETFSETKASSLKALRQSGRFLVAICRFDLNSDFEGVLLRALQEALKKEESPLLMDTHYQEAIRRIDDWEDRRGKDRFYKDLESVISKLHPEWTINSLLEDLRNYKEDALAVFKDCFEIVTDSEFGYSKDNLRDILTDLLQNDKFNQSYKGIVFLYDEFGSAIDKGLVDYDTMLAFSQFCAESRLEHEGIVIFIGSGHRPFVNHGKLGDLNSQTLNARVTEIGLETQGMEDIISAIVHPLKESDGWKQCIATNSVSGKFTRFSLECKRLNLFSWLPAPKIKSNIIQNIYPMHPLATYSVLRLAGLVGEDNRSVVKFFSPEFETGKDGWKNVQLFSFPWFLENNEIVENGKLKLYTQDLLADYFAESLKSDNNRLMETIKKSVVNYETTLHELNSYIARKNQELLFDQADDLMDRILKVMLMNDIVSTQDATIVNTNENIYFGLDIVEDGEKQQVDDRLKLLCDSAIIYRNDRNIYELMPGDRKDVKRIIDQYKANPDNKPSNLLEKFLKYTPLNNDETYLDAKDYNSQYNEDKRMIVKFALPSMFAEKQMLAGKEQTFFEKLELERVEIIDGYYSYEGTAVYAFCESEVEINNTKKLLSKNDQERVVIAVPKQPLELFDAIFTLEAINSEFFKAQSDEFSPYEKAEEKKIRDSALKTLKETKENIFSNKNVNWFGNHGGEISVNENIRHDVANRIIQKIYTKKRNTFPHAEFNKIHQKINGKTLSLFKEAADLLCPLLSLIEINWTWPDNRGGTLYLRRCFIEYQVLKIIEPKGDTRLVEVERNSNKFSNTFPAFTFLLEKLAELENKGAVSPLPLIQQLRMEFGQGNIAITFMLLLARRFYGDSLRFKGEQSHLMDMQFEESQAMLDLVCGERPSAVLIFEPVSEIDQRYFQIITQTFENQPGLAGRKFTIGEARNALVEWWKTLPIIAKSNEFYTGNEKELAELISQAAVKDAYSFIKRDLIEKLGFQPGGEFAEKELDQIKTKFEKFKTYAEDIQLSIQKQILKEIAQLFNAVSELDLDVQEALKNWYIGLSNAQKDSKGFYHTDDSRPLVKYTNYADIPYLLFKTFPETYGFGEVLSWTNNQVAALIEHIKRGKEHIESNAPKIGQLQVDFENAISQQDNQVTFKGSLTLHAKTDDGTGTIYYTTDGSDPTANKYRKKLNPGDSLHIEGNSRVKLVVADGEGNYSAVKVFDAIDELKKFGIYRNPNPTFLDEIVHFVFPKDQESSQITISTLFEALIKGNIVKNQELKRFVDDLLNKTKSEKK